MKVLSKQEEEAHYKEVLKGGTVGGVFGLGLGLAGVMLGGRRYATIRNLTLPFKSFIVSSAATFCLIINADRTMERYKSAHNPMYGYKDTSSAVFDEIRKQQSTKDRVTEWARENRYGIVFGSWVASMGTAFAIVNRSKYMSAAQKVVQARVYAQGLTVAVLVVTAIFEMNDAKKGGGRWKTVMVADPNDPEHKRMIEKKVHKEEYEGQDLWKDMVEAEERRIQERKKQNELEQQKQKQTEEST